ncbi:MAG: glycosyltransferase [Candidatus Hodarchaeota archaeon]
MSKKNVYIISLKYSPGLHKEFHLIGNALEKKGFTIKYLLSNGYANFEDKHDGVIYITKAESIKGILFETLKLINCKTFEQIFYKHPPIFLCFYNPHPLNPFIARLIKKNYSDVINSLHLHDPYKPNKMPYGIIKMAYFGFVELIQSLTVKYMDYVISPSKYSSILFRIKFPNFKGKNLIAPLLVPDQKITVKKNQKYFCIVGTVHQATGHDTFIKLANYAASNDLDYEFAIITSSNISKYIKNLTDKGKKKIKIINKKVITDLEINELLRESFAVFKLDREVTQSGVIPVAYMNGAPVIATDIPGLKQNVNHKKNGYIVPLNCDLEYLIKAMEFVKTKFSELSKNARKSYEETWSEWTFDRHYNWLIELLTKKSN